jgi:Ca-activated chloride channel homolog
MVKLASRAFLLLSLLVLPLHQATPQGPHTGSTAGNGIVVHPSGVESHGESRMYLAMLGKEADLRPFADRPVAVSKAGQQEGPPPHLPGVGGAGAGPIVGISGGTAPYDLSMGYLTLLQKKFERELSPLEDPAISVSKLDLKAPGKARKEYEKAFKLLYKKDYQSAAEHLGQAVSIYPEFVAAHNALGSSYLAVGQNEQARDEFARAVALDDHLPISHLNLGCAEFALKHYGEAEAAVQKASSIAPLDLQVLAALAYAQLMNHNYTGAIATAQQVHKRNHKEVGIVHFYAAAAWDGLNNQREAQHELQTLLKEDPKSPAAQQALLLLKQIEEDMEKQTVARLTLTPSMEIVPSETPTTPAETPAVMQEFLQQMKQAQQVAEVENMCEGCGSAGAPDSVAALHNPDSHAEAMSRNSSGWTLHRDVDEVAVFFAATDHGKAVSDLTAAEVTILDSYKPPDSISGFCSEAQLPLRLGLVIDTSESVTGRFSFEQAAAANFVRKVLTGKDDLAFVVGFSNSVLLVQDFTGDNGKISEAINKLAPAGGTSAWDAVAFAADKLSSRPERQPVARVLVLISDGEDNSSSATLKQAIETAEQGEVTIYAVSTHEDRAVTVTLPKEDARLGDEALRVLANRTGGSAFFPGSLGHLNHGLDDLEQVIRSRYMISYRPALFKRDGQYRSIDITARKSGHKLHVYARKGYHAQASALPGGGGL